MTTYRAGPPLLSHLRNTVGSWPHLQLPKSHTPQLPPASAPFLWRAPLCRGASTHGHFFWLTWLNSVNDQTEEPGKFSLAFHVFVSKHKIHASFHFIAAIQNHKHDRDLLQDKCMFHNIYHKWKWLFSFHICEFIFIMTKLSWWIRSVMLNEQFPSHKLEQLEWIIFHSVYFILSWEC